jgi:hypothetical protein
MRLRPARRAIAWISRAIFCGVLASPACAEEASEPELTLVSEIRWEVLLGESMDRYEASGVVYTGERLISVFDNDARIAVLAPDLSARSVQLIGEKVDGQSNFEGIAYDVEAAHFYVVVEAEQDVEKLWRGRVLQYDAELRLLRSEVLETVLPSGKKGFEGLAFLRRGGAAYLLVLFEGNHAAGGKKGKEPGHGRIEVLRRDATSWRTVTRMELPENAAFVDYAGIDVRGERLAVVSQSSARLWVGRLASDEWRAEGPGMVYAFPRGPAGADRYCKIEGVSWLDDRSLAFVSDKSRECADVDQSIHVFRLPD